MSNPRQLKRFSDFSREDKPLDGDKVSIDSVLNQEVTVTGYRITDSKYKGKNKSGKCLTIQMDVDGCVKVVFTGSDVLIRQLEEYGSEIPFLTQIKKINRYYTFS